VDARHLRERSAEHRLYFLDVPDEVCMARLRQRNAGGTHDFAANDHDALPKLSGQ
jgi:hypothetical protein